MKATSLGRDSVACVSKTGQPKIEMLSGAQPLESFPAKVVEPELTVLQIVRQVPGPRL